MLQNSTFEIQLHSWKTQRSHQSLSVTGEREQAFDSCTQYPDAAKPLKRTPLHSLNTPLISLSFKSQHCIEENLRRGAEMLDLKADATATHLLSETVAAR